MLMVYGWKLVILLSRIVVVKKKSVASGYYPAGEAPLPYKIKPGIILAGDFRAVVSFVITCYTTALEISGQCPVP